jgi:hypothetical protein
VTPDGAIDTMFQIHECSFNIVRGLHCPWLLGERSSGVIDLKGKPAAADVVSVVMERQIVLLQRHRAIKRVHRIRVVGLGHVGIGLPFSRDGCLNVAIVGSACDDIRNDPCTSTPQLKLSLACRTAASIRMASLFISALVHVGTNSPSSFMAVGTSSHT